MECKKIAVAVSLDSDTEAVVAYAAWLADACGKGVKLVLLHVMDYALTPPAYLLRYIEDEKVQKTEILNRLSCKLVEEHHIDAGHEVVLGRLTDAVRSYVRENKCDVLVLGYKHHMVRASSAGRLIRSLRRPMLVVRGERSSGAFSVNRIQHILCPIDFSDNSVKALKWAAHFARCCSARLSVMHIEPEYDMPHVSAGPDETAVSERAAVSACSDMSGLIREIDPELRPDTVVRRGDPVAIINEFSSDKDIDLIVMGARGKSFFEGLLLGSVSESVIRSSLCPVFIVH
ncbi:MAG TPA: universal stress protein [Dissulfurispiraceae bacterium]|nr:universal stress protein [Dissulfurispiraceae bacterium]